MKKRTIAALLTLSMVMGMSSSCYAEEMNPGDYTFAFATILTNHPVLRQMELGFAEACEELGYQWQIVGTEGSDRNEMNAAAEAFAAAGGNAVMLNAQDKDCFATIKTLHNDYECLVGVAHYAYDQADIPELDFNMACDCETYAISVADFMAEQLEGKTGKIAITQSNYNVTEDTAAAAFAARIEEIQSEGKLEGITVMEPVIEGDADLTENTNVITSLLQANTDIVGAFGLCGYSASAWANAARKCGYSANDLVIVAMDALADNIAEIETGYVTALVAQPLYEEAYRVVYNFDAMLHGEEVEYWTELEAPLVYADGEGVHAPAYYTDIIDRVSEMFGD